MTLLFFDGVQDPGLIPKPEYATPFDNAGTGRDGASNGSGWRYATNGAILIVSPGSSALVAACATLPNSNSFTATTPIMDFRSALSTVQLVLCLNPSIGKLEVRRTNTTGTLLGTSSGHALLTAGSWFHVQMKASLNASAGGSVEVRLNGVTVLSLTGQTTSSVTQNVTHVGWGQNFTSAFYSWLTDDIYVCDTVDATATQGQPNNDFLGDLRVAALLPSAAGDTTQWTPSTGANYTDVDEIPANTTDYVSDSVTGHRDLYNLADPAGTIGSVYGVRACYYATKTDAGAATLKPVIKENTVVTVGAAQGLSYGSWTGVHSAAWFVRPSDSAAWTSADLTALQVGMDVG